MKKVFDKATMDINKYLNFVNKYNEVIVLWNGEKTFNGKSLVSVINALVVAMCLKRPEEVKQNLKNLEYAWNNYQVYLNDEIDFIDEETMLKNPLTKEEIKHE